MTDSRQGSPAKGAGLNDGAAAEDDGTLLRLLGVGFGLAGTLGGTLGAGILRTPGLVAAQMGTIPLFLGAWILGGIYALLGAICLSELGTSLPRAGGWTVYAQRAFGNEVGFSVGWIDWLGHCAGLAWVAITIGEYTAALMPSLPVGPRPVAISLLLVFSLIQLRGVVVSGGVLQLLSLAKTIAFIVLVGACFLLGGHLSAELTGPEAGTPIPFPGAGQGLSIAATVVALQAVITTFEGWHNPIYFAEEFSEPQRDLPRALIGGVLTIATIYVLVNLSLLVVLPLPVIAGSKLPVADAARLIFGGASSTFITVLVLLSLLGLINARIMASPRILYGLARDGLIPESVARVNAGGTPVVALACTWLAASTLVVAGDFQGLLGIASFLYVVLYLLGFSALIVLRWQEPDLPRPFRTWLYPLPAAVVLAGSVGFLLAAALNDTLTSLVAMLLILVGPPLQRITRRSEATQG